MNIMLGQTVVDIPLSDTMKWFAGLLGFITVLIAIGTLVLICKKLFGRKPPIDKAMAELEKKMVGLVMHQKNSALKEMAGRHSTLVAQQDDIKARVAKAEADILKIQEERALALRRLNRRFERILISLAVIGTKVGAQMPDEESEEA